MEIFLRWVFWVRWDASGARVTSSGHQLPTKFNSCTISTNWEFNSQHKTYIAQFRLNLVHWGCPILPILSSLLGKYWFLSLDMINRDHIIQILRKRVYWEILPQHGCHSWLWTSLIHWQGHLKHHKIITSLLMSREWLYTALSQDALKNTSNSLMTPFLVCHLFPNRKRCWILKDVLGRRFLVEEDGKKGLAHLLPFARVQRD